MFLSRNMLSPLFKFSFMLYSFLYMKLANFLLFISVFFIVLVAVINLIFLPYHFLTCCWIYWNVIVLYIFTSHLLINFTFCLYFYVYNHVIYNYANFIFSLLPIRQIYGAFVNEVWDQRWQWSRLLLSHKHN